MSFAALGMRVGFAARFFVLVLGTTIALIFEPTKPLVYSFTSIYLRFLSPTIERASFVYFSLNNLSLSL